MGPSKRVPYGAVRSPGENRRRVGTEPNIDQDETSRAGGWPVSAPRLHSISMSEPAAEVYVLDEAAGRRPGVLPAQQLEAAIAREWIRSDLYKLPRENVQPASLDLRLGDFAWA